MVWAIVVLAMGRKKIMAMGRPERAER